MLRWTLKSLIGAPLALIASISAVASALLLVMLFEAVFAGESEKIVAYLHNADADVWVMQSDVSNMHMATSYLADWKLAEIREVPGVTAADAILYLGTAVKIGARQWFTYIVGLDVPSRQAGPWAMVAGNAQPGPGEAVLPALLAEKAGLGLGDTVRIIDRDFTIVGLSKGTFSMANSLIFVTRPDLEDIMTSLNIVSFILVKAEAGTDPAIVAANIERMVDKVSALPSAQFIANDKRLVMQMGVETIALMTFIGGALAMLLVAFAVYSQVTRQRQELAVIKALGATNWSLYASIAFQATTITLVSVVLATLLAVVLLPWITTLIPIVSLQLTATAVARVALIGIAVALLASLLPTRQIARVDPLSAFRGTL